MSGLEPASEYLMPCASCRLAKWFGADAKYGQCGHPLAVAAREPRPYALKSPPVETTIAREWIWRDMVAIPTCPTHEPLP